MWVCGCWLWRAQQLCLPLWFRNRDEDGKHLLVMKGAPEIVFPRCDTILVDGEDVNVNEEIKKQFREACEKLAGMGQRVLAFVDLCLDPGKFPSDFNFSTDDEEPNFPLDNLRFIGLMSMIDPPMASVPDAVSKCWHQGGHGDWGPLHHRPFPRSWEISPYLAWRGYVFDLWRVEEE